MHYEKEDGNTGSEEQEIFVSPAIIYTISPMMYWGFSECSQLS